MATTQHQWASYLEGAMEAAGYRSNTRLAADAGIKQPVISRWLSGDVLPDMTNLRKLAGPLGVPMLELAVAAGHLTPAEAGVKLAPRAPVVERDPTVFSNEELLAEVNRRMRPDHGRRKPRD